MEPIDSEDLARVCGGNDMFGQLGMQFVQTFISSLSSSLGGSLGQLLSSLLNGNLTGQDVGTSDPSATAATTDPYASASAAQQTTAMPQQADPRMQQQRQA